MMKKLAILFLLFAVPVLAQQVVQVNSGVLSLDLRPGNGVPSFKVPLNQNVTSIVLQNPTGGMIMTIMFVQDSSGGHTVTFPATVSNGCSVNSAANALTSCQFQYDSITGNWSGVGGSSGISPTTVSGLGAYAVKGNIVPITDGTNTTDCTVGGGTTAVVCQYTGSAWTAVGGTGTGSVTTFSAGTLSPLFTTSVATATTTPALSFSLSTAAANTVFGNFTGGVAAPTFSAAPAFSAANLTNFPTLNQNTSGSAASLSSTLGCAVFPALTGDTTTSAGSCATTTAKINGTALSGLATGILKNTTGTGVPSIAIAADFPTLNQNTSGTASNLSGTPTLPNGTLATTQAAGSNDTKLATDAYVDGHLIFEGTVTLGTSAIASGAKTAPVTVSATGVATTDVVSCGFNGDPTAVTGYGVSATGAVLTIYPYPTANNINVIVGNNTSGSITPGALTLNCLVVRK